MLPQHKITLPSLLISSKQKPQHKRF